MSIPVTTSGPENSPWVIDCSARPYDVQTPADQIFNLVREPSDGHKSRLVMLTEMHAHPLHLGFADAFRRACVSAQAAHVVMMETPVNLLEANLGRVIGSRSPEYYNRAIIEIGRIRTSDPATYWRLQHLAYGAVKWGEAPLTRSVFHAERLLAGTAVRLMDMPRTRDNHLYLSHPFVRSFVQEESADKEVREMYPMDSAEGMRLRNIWMAKACRQAAKELETGFVLASIGSAHAAGNRMGFGITYDRSLYAQTINGDTYDLPITLFLEDQKSPFHHLPFDGQAALSKSQTFIIRGLKSGWHERGRFQVIREIAEHRTLFKMYDSSGWRRPEELHLLTRSSDLRHLAIEKLRTAIDALVENNQAAPGLTPG